MEFTGNTTKYGQSAVGDCMLDYQISYDGDNKVTNLEARIRKVSDTMTRPIGNISYAESSRRYSFVLMEATTADERAALFADFEKTLAELQ